MLQFKGVVVGERVSLGNYILFSTLKSSYSNQVSCMNGICLCCSLKVVFNFWI